MRYKYLICSLVIVLILLLSFSALAGEKWLGTDDLVDRKMGEIAGVAAKEPLIDISEGNLGLFIFASGGFVAGALCGYFWRKLFVEKAGS